MAFKQWCDCVNYESNSCNYDNTWADQQAVIALRQHPAIVSCLLIVLCADSWHFSGVLIMRTVSRQLQKTTRYECAALTSVIDFIHFISSVLLTTRQYFPTTLLPLEFLFSLTFSIWSMQLFSIASTFLSEKLSPSAPMRSFFHFLFLSFHYFFLLCRYFTLLFIISFIIYFLQTLLSLSHILSSPLLSFSVHCNLQC